MNGAGAPRAARVAAIVGPPLLAVVCLLPAFAAGFVHDDGSQILSNPWLKDVRHLPTLFGSGVWAGVGGDSSWYRPLMMASFALEHALHGFDPTAMHALSIASFAATVAAASALVHRLSGDRGAAALAAALFAVHPINVEAAAWISARCELFAAGFGLLALWAHDRALAGRDGESRGLASAWLLGLALLGKESAVVFLPALLALDRVRGASFAPATLLRRHAGHFGVLALYAGLRQIAIGSASGGLLDPVDPLRALAFAGQGALRLVLPVGLTIEPAAPPPALALLGAVALLAGAAASVACWRRRSALLVPVVLGGGQLAIASVAAVRLDALADRYLLLPSLALGWLVANALAPLVRVRRRLAIGAIAVASLGLGGLSFAHARSFRSDTALFSRAWQRNPDSVRAALNLAAASLREGRAEEALVWLDRAEALSPGDIEIALNRAAARQRLGDPAKARALLQAALGSAPGDPRLHTALGHLAVADGRPDAARDHYLVATRVNPLRADAWSGLGIAQARLGELREARSALERALALDPDLEDAPALRTLLDHLPPY